MPSAATCIDKALDAALIQDAGWNGGQHLMGRPYCPGEAPSAHTTMLQSKQGQNFFPLCCTLAVWRYRNLRRASSADIVLHVPT
jgi:hypothetical protein